MKEINIGHVIIGLILIFVIGVPAFQYSAIGIEGVYNEKRTIQLGLFLCILIAFLVNKNLKEQTIQIFVRLPKLVQYGLISIFGVGIFSSVFAAKFQDWALLEVGHFTLIVIFTLVLAGIVYSNKEHAFNYIVIAVLGYVFFYVFRVSITYLLYQFGDYPLWPGSETSVGLFGFADKRFFNHTQTWTFPILLSLTWYFSFYVKKRWIQVSLWILSISWGMLLIASGGRGTLLGITVGFVVLFVFVITEKLKFLKFHFLITILTLITYYIFFEFLGGGTEPTLVRDHSSGRFVNWLVIIPDILERPFFGYGPMHYNSLKLDNWLGAPHSWFLQFAYEWGIIVGLILLAIACIGIYKFYTKIRIDSVSELKNIHLWIKVGLLWSIIAFFIHGLFSGLINTALSQGWFILIIGSSIGIYFSQKPNKVEEIKKYKLALVAVTIVSTLFIVQWAFQNSMSFEEINRKYVRKTGENAIPTRYWQQPKIGFTEKLNFDE